ncbi:MAG: hypothetical protein IPN33_14260 [Saprospiraceae bacterium]|nr:hypothetical protein [Saprospiraceae bacterium]
MYFLEENLQQILEENLQPLTYENAEQLLDYLYTGPRRYMRYSEFEALFDRYGIKQGRDETLQYGIDAGLLIAGANWREREAFIMGVTVTGSLISCTA